MLFLSGLFFRCLALAGAVAAHAIELDHTITTVETRAKEKSCPITQVDRFLYGCRRRGVVRYPQVFKTLHAVEGVKRCWSACHGASQCKSFRYIEENRACILYTLFLDEMYVDYENFDEGVLNDRYCYTTNCNLIDACNGTKQCRKEKGGPDGYGRYMEYACAHGYTSAPQHVQVHEFSFSGSKSPCEAVERCVRNAHPTFYYHGYYYGSIDLYYHIPSDKWVCRNFNDIREDTWDYIYPYVAQEDVVRTRFTRRNESVGASYGFWDYRVAYPPD